MNIVAIKNKVYKKQPVSVAEYLELLRNDEEAFWAFLISNNPGNVNNTLRHLLPIPYATELTFAPDQNKLARTIEMIREKEDDNELMEVLKNFVLKENGLDPVFVETFKTEFLS